MEPARQGGCDLGEGWRGLDHRCRDAVQARRADVALWIDERVVLVDPFPRLRIERDGSDFDDAIVLAEAGGLAVDDDQRRG